MNGEDNWKHRSEGMNCRTCMWFVEKVTATQEACDTEQRKDPFGRCRRNAPTMNGFPAVFGSDWCGNHKLNENRL